MEPTTEKLILSELTEIRRRLDAIYVPIQSERQRQLDRLPVEERKRIHREELRAEREAKKKKFSVPVTTCLRSTGG